MRDTKKTVKITGKKLKDTFNDKQMEAFFHECSIQNFDIEVILSDEPDDIAPNCLSNYQTIMLVRMIEIFFKSYVVICIDKYNMKIPQMRIIMDLENLQHDKLTIGNILANNINFQRLESIDEIFSEIFNIKFLDEVCSKSKISMKNIHNLIQDRHKIIHEGMDMWIENKQLDINYKIITNFLRTSESIIHEQIKKFR